MLDNKLKKAWLNYNQACITFDKVGIDTKNYLGEFSEILVKDYYQAKKTMASTPSFDLITNDGKKIQVKSRRIEKLKSTQLNTIRSWDFDLLVVVLFNLDGKLLKALEIQVDIAKEYGRYSEHQNGFIISTTKKFLNDSRFTDITNELNQILK